MRLGMQKYSVRGMEEELTGSIGREGNVSMTSECSTMLRRKMSKPVFNSSGDVSHGLYHGFFYQYMYFSLMPLVRVPLVFFVCKENSELEGSAQNGGLRLRANYVWSIKQPHIPKRVRR